MEDWPALCRAEELEAEGSLVNITLGEGPAKRRIVALRHAGRLRVYENRCPHLGTPLGWGAGKLWDESGTKLACQTHGALFAPADGLCLEGPCRGESLNPLPFEVDGEGRLRVDLAAALGPPRRGL